MKALDSKVLKKFITLASSRLRGEWVVIGGTVLPLLGIHSRVTTDIDLVPIEISNMNSAVLELMKLSEELGLPVETVNQAGVFFLEKISDYRECLVVLKRSKTATIYRPNVSLFVQLKIGRLSESDLQDCLAFIAFAGSIREEIDHKRIKTAIQRERKRADLSPEKQARLTELQKALD